MTFGTLVVPSAVGNHDDYTFSRIITVFSFVFWDYFSEIRKERKEKTLFRKEFHAQWDKDKLMFKSDEVYDEQ